MKIMKRGFCLLLAFAIFMISSVYSSADTDDTTLDPPSNAAGETQVDAVRRIIAEFDQSCKK